jgi:hypothetical protein
MKHLNENGVKLLTGVAEWLEKGAPHVVVDATGEEVGSFDMSEVAGHDGCGTACCIAGAVVAFNPDQFTQFGNLDDRMWYGLPTRYGDYKHKKGDVFTDVRLAAGISVKNATALFEPDDMDLRTPEEGAKVIREFIKTGKVTWSEIDDDF